MMGEAEKLFIEAYERERETLPGSDIGWVRQRRSAAFDAFTATGLPHRRLEDWRYTDLRQALARAVPTSAPVHEGSVLPPGASTRPSAGAFDGIDRHVAVFVNGMLRDDLSRLDLPEGAEVKPLGSALDAGWARTLVDVNAAADGAAQVMALNTALMRGGAAIHIHKGVKLDKPLHLLFLAADGGAFHARNLIRLEEGAAAEIFESHVDAGGGAYFADFACDVSIAEGASLTHLKLQDEGSEAIHLSSLTAQLSAHARLSTFSLALGAKLSRSQTFVRFAGEHALAEVDGATALRGRQHGDHFVAIDHAVPNCRSSTLFKTVLDDAATGVFQGKVVVRPDAQKTDGRQMSNALLLSRDAAMNAKPELEIYADDVQCAHGSTIGELNRDALFYLRSRGIDEATARQLLVSAFLDEAFEHVPHDAARDALRNLAAEWFRTSGEAHS